MLQTYTHTQPHTSQYQSPCSISEIHKSEIRGKNSDTFFPPVQRDPEPIAFVVVYPISRQKKADPKPITSPQNFLTMATDEADAALNHQGNGFARLLQ